MRRYGYRRINVLLRREGWEVNVKRSYRLYRELGLQLRNKTPKRRVKAKLREDRRPAVRANDILRQSPDCRPFGNRIIRLLADDGRWTSSRQQVACPLCFDLPRRSSFMVSPALPDSPGPLMRRIG